MTTPEQLAHDTLDVIDDAIADGRAAMAVRLLLEAFAEPQLVAALSPAAAIMRVLGLWKLAPAEGKRGFAGLQHWLDHNGIEQKFDGWVRAWFALERTLAGLPDEYPAPILAIIAEVLLDGELIELKPRLRRWAWANPEAAKRGSELLPEPDPLAELLGRGGNPLRDLVGEALAVPQRGTRPLAPAEAIARARTSIESADGEHARAEAWRALHDLLFEQTLATSAAVVEAVEPLLADWPDSLRVTLCASPWDFDIVTGVEEPAHRLIRSLQYNWMFVSRAGKIMIRNPRLDAQDGLRLARSPSAKWLTRINLDRQPLGPQVAEALARSRQFEGLEQLTLAGCELQTRGVVALARGNFPALTHAALSSNEAGPEAARAWAEFSRGRGVKTIQPRSGVKTIQPRSGVKTIQPRSGELTLLDLSRNPIAEGVVSFANAPIAELQLAECQLSASVLPEFAATKLTLDGNALGPELRLRAPRLRELSASQIGLGDEGLAGLVLPELEQLTLEGNEITARGLSSTSVIARSWTLSRNPIGDAGFAAVLARPGCRQLTARASGLTSDCFENAALDSIETLDLLDNEVAQVRGLVRARALRHLTVGAISLADISADWPPLESLAVFGPLDDRALPGVIPSQRLWLNDAHFDDAMFFELLAKHGWRPHRLAIAATSGSGETLDAFGQLSDAALVALADSPIAERLQTLRLPGHRKISSEGLIALARSPYLSKLERLDIGHCSIDDAGVLEFLRARPQVLLDVEGNPYSQAAAAALEAVHHC